MHKGLTTADPIKYYTHFGGFPDNSPTLYPNPFAESVAAEAATNDSYQ